MRFQRKYNVNNSFFKIWTHEMAYILGFWFADGHITGDIFCISQKTEDEYILEEMLDCMSSNYPIYKNGKQSCFMIRSKEIVNSIKLLGGNECKSLTAKMPYIPSEYLPDFLRGLWDGDGSITKQFNRKSYSTTLTSGSRQFVKQLQKELINNISGFKGGSITTSISKKGKKMPHGKMLKKDSIYYSLCLSTNDTKRLGKYMYPLNCTIKLLRKATKFAKLTKIQPATYDKQYVTYDTAKIYASSLGLKNWRDWKDFSASGKRPSNIPSNPNRTYRREFKNIKDFLGVNP